MNIQLEATQRVKDLREYYIHNSPMSVDRDLVCWKCHRSLYYYVEGWLKSTGATTTRMRRSMAEAYMLEHLAPVICPGELIVGQPDFTPFSPEEEQQYAEYVKMEAMMPAKRGRADHLALDYQLLFDVGVTGIIADLEGRIRALDFGSGESAAKYEYYKCCIIELEGLLKLAEHYAAHAAALAEQAEGKEKEELLELAAVLTQVPAGPARTFREALQSIQMFTFSLYGIYSFGRFDRYLYPYYLRDIQNGVLTPESAQELVDCFYLQSVPNMSAWAAEGLMIGGRDENGVVTENALTWHVLTAIAHTHVPDPNTGFCVTKDTGKEILQYAAEIIKAGHAQPQIWNSDAVTESMLHYGFDPVAANNFTLSTCVEITPAGCSGVSITSPYINLLKILLDAMEDYPDGGSFEKLFRHFRDTLEKRVQEIILDENLQQLERGRNSTDPMRISVLIHDCTERALSNDCGGARYNQLEPNILGMQNTTESLNVLQRLVYDQKMLTLSEFKEALKENYEGYEDLLAYIRNKVPHFGTGEPEATAMGKRVADTILEVFADKTTVRGAAVIPGGFSYRDHELHGRQTGASPDGRKAGMPLNDGSCPVQGYDNLGPTLSLMSTTAWEPARFLGGTSVNVKINKDVTADTIVELIRGYIKTKGSQMQFNIVDPEELLDAQKHPENHGDLLVRIGGYSDFFVKIPKALQDDVIARAQNQG